MTTEVSREAATLAAAKAARPWRRLHGSTYVVLLLAAAVLLVLNVPGIKRPN